jgi:hypothetical protein
VALPPPLPASPPPLVVALVLVALVLALPVVADASGPASTSPNVKVPPPQPSASALTNHPLAIRRMGLFIDLGSTCEATSIPTIPKRRPPQLRAISRISRNKHQKQNPNGTTIATRASRVTTTFVIERRRPRKLDHACPSGRLAPFSLAFPRASRVTRDCNHLAYLKKNVGHRCWASSAGI